MYLLVFQYNFFLLLHMLQIFHCHTPLHVNIRYILVIIRDVPLKQDRAYFARADLFSLSCTLVYCVRKRNICELTNLCICHFTQCSDRYPFSAHIQKLMCYMSQIHFSKKDQRCLCLNVSLMAVLLKSF